MIVLQFVSGSGLGSDAIRWFSAGGWSHVDAVLPDGRLLGARSDHVGGAPPGVQIRDATYVGDSPVLRLQLPCTDEMAADFYGFLRSQLGKPYDFDAIAGFAFHRDWQEDSAWICSELQGAGLVKCRWFEYGLAVPANQLPPQQLLIAISAKVPLPKYAPVEARLPTAVRDLSLNGAD